ncbi:MAG: NADPH-dependent oxidoreductase [Chloroflexota bacterium]
MSTTYSTPVTDVQNSHVTIRSFTDKPIPDDMVQTLLDAGRRAPTSSNMQTYSIMVVRNPETKKQLAVLAGGQKHIEVCPVFMAFCADIRRLAVACEMHGETHAKTLESSMVSTVDAALVGMSVQTAAESFGLGAVMIGGMRNHPRQVADLLGFPPGVFVVYGMCLGWPDEANIPAQKPRLPESLVVHYEKYDDSDPVERIRQYDQELAQHYDAQNRNLDQAAWTGVLAKQLNAPRRPDLRTTLEGMGFRFD